MAPQPPRAPCAESATEPRVPRSFKKEDPPARHLETSLGSVAVNYRALLKVAIVLNSQRNTRSLFHAITAELKQVISWERAGITIYDPERDAFRFYAMETNLSKVVLQRDIMIPRHGSAVGWVYEHQRMHVRTDLQREQVFLEDKWYAEEGLGRMINLPLLVQTTCLGTLNIGSVESGEPDPSDLEFLNQVAMQIAYAIDHVQAYEQINRLRERLARENAYLTEELRVTQDAGAMVGRSRSFQHVLELAREVAPTTGTVLITGETGTGKELLALAIHEWSPRRDKPFVRVNCAALPIGLVESELFGHERGAFTGADHRRIGRFELADKGTLFLDEISELPLEAQAKLLRALQEGMVDRVGGTQTVPVDVRIIAATNADLSAALAQGRFRSDLFYRLAVFPICIPPLRERPEDIPVLAQHFVAQYRNKLKRPAEVIEPASLQRLIRYPWPGNVRELQNVIERAMILSRASVLQIDEHQLTPHISAPVPPSPAGLQDLERTHILQTLALTSWRIEGAGGAAERLGLAPSTLRSRLKKLGIQRPADPARQ